MEQLNADSRLTIGALRQHLAETVPGFVQVLAESLSMEPSDLLRHVSASNVANLDALVALAKHAVKLKNELELDC